MARTGVVAERGGRPDAGASRTGRYGDRRRWVVVAGETLDDDVLAVWVERARAFVATLPAPLSVTVALTVALSVTAIAGR
jgi:hypothetical protein